MTSLEPDLILKIIGYGAFAYASIPNYGLINEDTIPKSQLPRHLLISILPLGVFIVASILFATKVI